MKGIDYASVCYERMHKCPDCGGELGLREKKGNGQVFVCKKCTNEYWLEFLSGELTHRGKAKSHLHRSMVKYGSRIA